MDIGYDFCLDRATLQSRFVVADIFQGCYARSSLENRGILHCSAFFHLFSLAEQISAAKNIAKLAKNGEVIIGRQIGSIKPGDVPVIKDGSFSYRHDIKMFNTM